MKGKRGRKGDRPPDRWAERQTDRQTDRQTEWSQHHLCSSYHNLHRCCLLCVLEALATLHFPLPMSTPDHVTPAFCPNSSTCRPCTTLSISILNGFSYISFVYTFVSQPFHLIYPSSVDLIALPRGLILEMLPVHCHQNLLLAQGVERETDGETQTTLSVLTLPRIRKYLSKARFLDKVKLTAFSSGLTESGFRDSGLRTLYCTCALALPLLSCSSLLFSANLPPFKTKAHS